MTSLTTHSRLITCRTNAHLEIKIDEINNLKQAKDLLKKTRILVEVIFEYYLFNLLK
jgi:hypothetical protein